MKPIRLHLGCGDKFWPGWVNCDLLDEADVNTDCRKLPFTADYADEIQAIHLVEHIPRLDVENMLMDWHRVMKPGGKLVIEIPCLNKIAQNIVGGEKDMRLTTLGIFGDPRDQRPGMTHQWAYTEDEIIEALQQSGFDKAEVMEPMFHIKQRDMRVEAIKP